MPRLPALLALIATVACTAAPAPPDRGRLAPSGCPLTGSAGWAAWIDSAPGSGPRPRLVATGKVETPTGGYRIRWADMRVLESYPVQIVADLEVLEPSGGATEAVVTHDVRGEWPVEPPVGSFTVRCGDKLLAQIAPVPVAR